MAIFHIVGLDHFLQNLRELSLTEPGRESERQQKRRCEEFLAALILEQHIDLIAEEGIFDADCLGSRLATRFHVPYITITMPLAERNRLGIQQDYDETDETRDAAYRAFERYMFDRVAERIEARTGLILCGRQHLDPLNRLFIPIAECVRTYDVNEFDWFLGRPMESNRGIVGFDRAP